MSFQVRGSLQRNPVGEVVSCFGIDFQSTVFAPGDEVGPVSYTHLTLPTIYPV